jgi:MFS family permease
MTKESTIVTKGAAIISMITAIMFYLISYVSRAEPGVLINDLMEEFNLTSSAIGYIISFVYLPYVIMQIPCGLLVDRLGVRAVLTFCAVLCSLGTFIFGIATTALEMEIGRFLIGAASAPAYLSCGKIASNMFSKDKYAILIGIAMASGCIGGAMAGTPTATLASAIGWRSVTFIIAGLLGVIALLSFVFIKGKDKEAKTEKSNGEVLKGLKMIAMNPGAWVIGLYGAVSYLPLSAMAELWGVPFIQNRFAVSTEVAGTSSVLLFIGFGLGSVLCAYEAKLFKSYKKTIIVNTLLLMAAIYPALYSDSISLSMCLVLLFFVGVFAGADTLCFTLAYKLIPEKYAGTSAGFMNAIIMSSGLVFQPVLGALLDFFRHGAVNDSGGPLYTLGTYREAFYAVIISMVIATVLTFFIKEPKDEQPSGEP